MNEIVYYKVHSSSDKSVLSVVSAGNLAEYIHLVPILNSQMATPSPTGTPVS